MMLIARHIIDVIGEKKLEQLYRYIANDSWILDTFTDIVTPAHLIGARQNVASQIKPSGE